MSARAVRVGLVGASRADVRLVRAVLHDSHDWAFTVEDLCGTGDAEEEVLASADGADVLLYWLTRDVVDGDHRLRRAVCREPRRPVVVMSDLADPESLCLLAAAGVAAVVPPAQWTVTALPAAIALALAKAEHASRTAVDVLTGLPTRGVFADRLDHLMERARRDPSGLALLLVDVDDLKSVNDTLGHDAGDVFLHGVGTRLREALRRNDTVARLGGDEFGVILEDVDPPEAALRVARKIHDRVCRPMTVNGSVVPVSLSIGAVVPSREQRRLSPAWLTQAADTALYAAKRNGKGQVSLFTQDMDRALVDRIQLEDDLAGAAGRSEFTLHYQPVVTAVGAELVGFEALLRWQSPRAADVGPGRFVPVLERIGLMPTVGRALFAEGFAALARWRRDTGTDLRLHLNVSASQVIDQQFSTGVLRLLAEHEVPPEAVVLELTESLLFKQAALLTGEFAKLHWAGVGLAIDDFGTGYNSFTYLKRVPVDLLKIDRTFVTNVATSRQDAAIVSSVLHLAERLGIAVVAEGVETADQLDALLALGPVDLVQGYLTGPPRPAEQALLRAPLRAERPVAATAP